MRPADLAHLRELLSTPGEIPDPSRCKLLELVSVALDHSSVHERKAERDALIRQWVESLGPGSMKARARRLAVESKRLHQGRKSDYEWISRAHRIYPLPTTARQFENILRQRSRPFQTC